LAATENDIVPLPDPDTFEVMVIQVAVLEAVQLQPSAVVKSTEPVDTPAPTDAESVLRL
jgi:hypothetical protein